MQLNFKRKRDSAGRRHRRYKPFGFPSLFLSFQKPEDSRGLPTLHGIFCCIRYPDGTRHNGYEPV
jgi:hypothetical protein